MLQAAVAVHVGVDNLNVVRYVDRLIHGMTPCKPFELLHEGDLPHLMKTMLDKREPGMTKVTNFKRPAEEEMIASGQVRTKDKAGNDEADEAADYGEGSVLVGIIGY